MVDGATLLEELKASPGRRVLLEHDQAVAIAQALASAQAMSAGQRRMDGVIAELGRAN